MESIFPSSFYQSSNVLALAQRLLGSYLHTQINGEITIGQIVETEAYKAPEDKASHAYQNKRTKRTEVMFSEGGVAYVYLCYGIHEMFNVVSGPKDVAHAILVRAIKPIKGLEIMERRRKTKHLKNLANGPGKLCQAMGISRKLSGLDLCKASSSIFITAGKELAPKNIVASPRVGIKYAEEDALLPWRFYVKDSPFISLPRIVGY